MQRQHPYEEGRPYRHGMIYPAAGNLKNTPGEFIRPIKPARFTTRHASSLQRNKAACLPITHVIFP